MEGFKALGLSEETLAALEKKGFTKPSPIQELTIPLLLNGEKDIVGHAQTGSGKTAAFGIPIIEKFNSNVRGIQALVLTPTRELALQVTDELLSYKGNRRMWFTTVYGGAPIGRQISDLEKGTSVVVGTPGRVIDLLNRGKLKLDEVKFVVLDEADEMLNMGFLEDVETILAKCNVDRRMLLFSATMPDRILSLAKRYMGNFDLISVKSKELTTESIAQSYFEVPARNRFDALCRVLDIEEDFYGIIFCNTKAEVIEITNHLNEKGYTADSLHGDIAQNLREKVVRQFKSNKYGLLVATDVAARGIDIQDLTHVVNYGLPQDPESYVHRIGRTGRAGKTGKAIAIIDSNERRKLQFIQRITKAVVEKGKLPDASEMVAIKKRRLKEQVEAAIATEQIHPFVEYTQELVAENEPEVVIAALLKIFQGDDLDIQAYKVIKDAIERPYSRDDRGSDRGRDRDRGDRGRDRDRGDRGGRDRDRGSDRGDRGRDRDRGDRGGRERNSRDAGSTMRLFVAKGRHDSVSPQEILKIIADETNIPGRKIDDIKILDAFSFFTTNNEDGEYILDTFKKIARKNDEKPLIERARVRD
ncbi:MAG TPA: DEAD/DEAH box helicase [Chitinophagales bacterium]|nr:DEAD/DEAH box helicase [Chitinophagales bacterium]